MLMFILGRVAQGLATLLVVTIIIFFSARLTGSPEFAYLSPDASPQDLETFRRTYGLDRPLVEQYWRWLSLAVRGDLGRGIFFSAPVFDLVLNRLGRSIPLAALSISFALLMAVPLGVLAATNRRRWVDRLVSGVGVVGQSVPSFWLGMVLVLVFAVQLRILPATGATSWLSYILPGLTLGVFVTAGAMRLVRSGMLESLEMDYIKFARAKGIPERLVVWKHALRNALVPLVTFLGYMFGAVVAASITVEVVFNWPGIGNLAYQAVVRRDFPVIQGIVLVLATVILCVNLIVDVIYLLLDPRVRIRA